MERKVIIGKSNVYSYSSSKTQFRPSVAYPEYQFKEDIAIQDNKLYDLFRNTLILGEYDKENIGKSTWNPLKDYVHPGDTVLVKPNFVMDHNPTGEGVKCLFTQPGLIAAVIDYILIAFKDVPGKIIVGDAPMQECNFEHLVEESGLDVMIAYYKGKGVDIELVDFRGLKSTIIHGIYHSAESEITNGTIIDLGSDSEFRGLTGEEIKRLRITNYNPTLLPKHHSVDRHEYFVSNYLLSADVVINMPKPKTHRKAGITGALKNMVGINVRKEFLPHHTMGSKDSDVGDEYLKEDKMKALSSWFKDKQNYAMSTGKYVQAQILKTMARVFFYADRAISNDHFSQGSWYGNETISRTICDLNKILLFADKKGIMKDQPQRRLFIVADMVVSGEKEGPIEPSKKDVGIIALADNSVVFDECIAPIMGVDAKDIPTIRNARKVTGKYQLVKENEYGTIVSNDPQWNRKKSFEISKDSSLCYIPSSGWRKVFYATQTEHV